MLSEGGLPPPQPPVVIIHLHEQNIWNCYSIQKVRSKYSEKLGQNYVQERIGLIDFVLSCTFDVNFYVSYSVL